MKTIEINEIEKYIDNAPANMNLMFIGDTGIGKTYCIKKYCETHKMYLKTLILSQLEASETLGIPVRSSRVLNGVEYNSLETAVPSWVFDLYEASLNKKDYPSGCMLFLDEFLCAQPSVMNAFLNFLTEKNVNGIDLSSIKIVSATNIGKYTFNPDNNILSRFCMFYVINTTAKDFVGETRINYSYKDENTRNGVIFETRSLKPRCLEQLSKIEDWKLWNDYYEGFTNQKYFYISDDKEINDLLYPYVTITNDGIYTCSKQNAIAIKAILKAKYPRIRNWNNIIAEFKNLDADGYINISDAFDLQ